MPSRMLLPIFTFNLCRFSNINNGDEQMAVNASNSQTENVWNGTGTSDTGSDWTRGGSGSEQTLAKYSGTNGLDTGVLSVNDTVWFNYGSNRDLESNFDFVSFWINIRSFPENSILTCNWETYDEYLVGNDVNISNYVPNISINSWQKVSIPISDFNLDGNVGKLVLQSSQTSGQRYYLDNVCLTNSSENGPFIFRVSGVANKIRHIGRIILSITSGEKDWNNDSFADIDGGLELGVILRQIKISDRSIVWSVCIRNNMELFGYLPSVEYTHFSNKYNMFSFGIVPDKSTISITEEYAIEFVIQDNLSSLIDMRAYLQCGIEEI